MKVIAVSPIRWRGKLRQPGAQLGLTKESAQAKLAKGSVRLPEAAELKAWSAPDDEERPPRAPRPRRGPAQEGRRHPPRTEGAVAPEATSPPFAATEQGEAVAPPPPPAAVTPPRRSQPARPSKKSSKKASQRPRR